MLKEKLSLIEEKLKMEKQEHIEAMEELRQQHTSEMRGEIMHFLEKKLTCISISQIFMIQTMKSI